jgi:hypothetical protein
VGGRWHRDALIAAVTMTAIQPDAVSTGIRLLSDIRTVWPTCVRRMTTADLLDALHTLDDAPWGADSVLSARRLAFLLRPYGIAPDHTEKDRGYLRDSFEETWSRYLELEPRP